MKKPRALLLALRFSSDTICNPTHLVNCKVSVTDCYAEDPYEIESFYHMSDIWAQMRLRETAAHKLVQRDRLEIVQINQSHLTCQFYDMALSDTSYWPLRPVFERFNLGRSLQNKFG